MGTSGPTTSRRSLPLSGNTGSQPLFIGLVLAALAIGLVMSFQSASLLTGTGTLWTGVAIAAGAAILGWVVRVPVWVRIVAGLAVLLAVANVLSVESQLQDKREQLDNIFSE